MAHDFTTEGLTAESSATDVIAVDELCSKFRSHYVLLDLCRFSEQHALTHGRVLRSSAERDDVYRALHEHPNSVVVFTGPVDDEVEEPILVDLSAGLVEMG
ncbi:MAG: hypothetical protein AAF581_20520 [Planctomycetota bacterium]